MNQRIVQDIRLHEKLYEIHNLLYELHVIRRCHYYTTYTENRFSAFDVDFAVTGKGTFWKLRNFFDKFQMKCILKWK